jgi:NAD(P)H-dependent FMN reductase
MAKLLAFAGSARRESFNKKLILVAAEAARKSGAEVTVLDLEDLNLPIFNEDDEAEHGAPEGAERFKALLKSHDGIIIASPEYNSSISALLKNALDWASRSAKGEAPLEAFSGKVALLLSASPGGLGGLRGLVHLRSILGNIKVIVLPEQLAVGGAHQAFSDDGLSLSDDSKQELLQAYTANLANITDQLKG